MSVRKSLRRWAQRAVVGRLHRHVDDSKILAAKTLELVHASHENVARLTEVEFKVFSQFGEDGILAYLISRIPSIRESFVEFGVSDYNESNTRFILESKNWRGLVIEAAGDDVASIRQSELFWKHDLTALHSFVTRENIDGLIADSGFGGEQGILSIDVDGNDYWIWKSISVIRPAIVVIEYNALWGKGRAVTIPYSPKFDRLSTHHSGLYFGASLRALWLLAQQKGYELVGSNSHGTNAFFVKRGLCDHLPSLSPDEAYVGVVVRQARNRSGHLIHASPSESLQLIGDLPLIDIEDGSDLVVGDLFTS